VNINRQFIRARLAVSDRHRRFFLRADAGYSILCLFSTLGPGRRTITIEDHAQESEETVNYPPLNA